VTLSEPTSAWPGGARPTRAPALPPKTLAAAPRDEPHLFFRRGRSYPRAIAWLGFTSFWGHLWHLAASVIATEDIDARDWMETLDRDAITARVATALGLHATDDDSADDGTTHGSLTERLGDDLWVDYIADTGDDADVSAAVADMMFREYRATTADGDDILLPRGHVLMFGGDTAYPVATQMEIHNRVCIPFNRVLRERDDGRDRVLMGIPGNHDWYDGLDGFARMFRARRGELDRRLEDEPSDTMVDTTGAVGHLIDWVEAFRIGKFVAKRATLPLLGYAPVQNASYFALRLAPQLDLWAVDRQLRAVDYAQQGYFATARDAAPDHGIVVAIPDPAFTMLEPYRYGQATLRNVDVDIERDSPLVLSGDTHHYNRMRFGDGMQVIAGGGGAFLHPARINRRGFEPPAAEFPGPRSSFALAMQVPWQIAGGRAGFVVHTAVALMYLPVLVLQLGGRSAALLCAGIAVFSTIASSLIGGWRKGHELAIGSLAGLCGAWLGGLPYVLRHVMHWLADGTLSVQTQALVAYLASIYPAALGFGTFLMVLTVTGLEQFQAFSALAHPGYKHFMRLRVRADGSAIDGWFIGKVDTLDPDADTVLVDRYCWPNPRYKRDP
jgi:hypothetical protein